MEQIENIKIASEQSANLLSIIALKDVKSKAIYLDRKSEDKDVDKYQKTQDPKILERLYMHRVPTIHAWVKKNYYPGLCLSEDDFFSELSITFLKAIEYYKIKKGSFNTMLYTLLDHRIKNIKNSLHAQKRTSKDYSGPLNGMLLSLNHAYGDNNSGDKVELQDCIAAPNHSKSELEMNDLLDVLSGGNLDIRDCLTKISNGENLSTILDESKIENIKVFKKSHNLYKNNKISKVLLKKALIDKLSNIAIAKKTISIKATNKKKIFEILSWNDEKESVEVKVKLYKTAKHTNIINAIKGLKNKKQEIMSMFK